MLSSSPAPKLASKAHRTFDGAKDPVAMLQYPDATLCTELENRVGETSRVGSASAWQISWQIWPSLPEEENTLAICAASAAALEVASNATPSATFTTRPVRRRSAGGSIAGLGSAVAAGTYGWRPVSTAAACGQLLRPGPSTPMPPTYAHTFIRRRRKSNCNSCRRNRMNC